jgi:hypothetical protein
MTLADMIAKLRDSLLWVVFWLDEVAASRGGVRVFEAD